MGSLFSKESSSSKVTARDRAVLEVKVQRDRLGKYRTRLEDVVAREQEAAVTLLRQGQRERALLALKKKKFQMQLLRQTEDQLHNLDEMIATIEFKLVEKKIVEGLKTGKTVLEQLNSELSLESVQQLMEDSAEAIAHQRAIDELLSEQLTPEDNAAVDAELQELMAGMDREETEAALDKAPAVPTGELEGSADVDAEEEQAAAQRPKAKAKSKGEKARQPVAA